MKNKGQFTSARLRGNQYAKGNPPNKTSYVKGHVAANFLGVGVPRILKHKRDGAQVITTIKEQRKARCRGKNYLTKRRVSMAQYVMGTPKGKVTYHLDQDPLNNDPSNLKIITRAELLRINIGCRAGRKARRVPVVKFLTRGEYGTGKQE